MKKLLFASVGIIALLFGACVKEGRMDGGFKNTLSVSVDLQGIGTEMATRGSIAPEQGEDKIESLYLLFFAPDNYKAGRFIDYVKIDGPLTMGKDIEVDLSGHPLLSVSAAYNILALANVTDDLYLGDDVDLWMTQWSDKTEAQVASEAMAWVEGSMNNDLNAIAPGMLLMNGRTEKKAEQYKLNFVLTRNVARFDVYNEKKENFDLVSVSIWNAYPSSSIWGEGVMNYSNAASRIRRFYGVDNSANELAVNGADGNPLLGNISGGLYVFENRVAAPVQNDQLTTCLIIGLRERSSGDITFYRANINPDESAQTLKRNNVYRLTIKNVGGVGKDTEEEAFTGLGNNLDYIINYWDLDDNGMIVQDGNSILSIPTKTIRIGRDGGDFSYSIFTFNNSGSGASLSIRSQTYDPATNDIFASLNGNVLNVTATKLAPGETERRGVVVLYFAGLEATVNIIQSASAETFLKVHLPDGGIPRFAPFAGISSGLIRVEASGPWTAKIYMAGFSFGPSVAPELAITTITSDGSYVTDNKFRIHTHSANPDPSLREAFIVVTLDSDPENYASMVRVAQSAKGGIAISPNQSRVTFNGTGTGLAQIANNVTNTFKVLPSMVDDGSGGQQIANWNYKIIQSGAEDDRGFFEVTDEQHHATNTDGNTITVNAVGLNASSRSYTATLRLYLTSSDPLTYTDIELVQQSATLDLSPNSFAAIPVIGGQTPLITVQADNSLKWSAKVVTNSGTATDGRVLVQHAAKLVDHNGNPIVAGTQYPISQQFRVVFPKVYYPNRGITISATVTVTVGGMTKTITVNQNALNPANMVGYGMTGSPAYGGLGNTYNQGWDQALGNIPTYNRLGVGNMSVTSINASVNYLHVVPHISGANGTNYNWSVVKDFMKNRDAWTVLCVQDDAGPAPANNANSPIKESGYQNVVYGGNYNGRVFTGHSSSKVYKFLFDYGHTVLSASQVSDFHADGINAQIPYPWPTTAVVLVSKNNNANNAMLIIDIKNKFLYIGESQFFWYTAGNAYTDGNRYVFLDNLMYFVGNAAKYGSHFTDLLLEDDQTGSMPAPWDEAFWGANKGVPSK